MRLPVMVYFASGGSSGAVTFSSAGFTASAGFFSSAGLICSAGLVCSADFIAPAGLIASAGFSGIIAHAKPCASHKKKLAKRHAKERPAQKNASLPLALALANNPTKKKEKVATAKPTAKCSSRRDKTLMRLLIQVLRRLPKCTSEGLSNRAA